MKTLLTRREFQAGAALSALLMARRAPAAVQGAPTLRAGAAEVKATPAAEGTFLIGPMKPSTGVSDDLFARALVLEDARQRFALVTLDYLGFDFAFTERLIRVAGAAAGVAPENVMLNCSHTHSAPLTAPWGPWKEHRDAALYRMLLEKLATAARRAAEELEPVQLLYRREPTQIGFNRRLFNGEKIVMAPNPQGAALPWVDVLCAQRADGSPLAVLFSHAAHPVIVHAASTLISGDYPGFAVEHLKNARGGDTVFLFAQGCSGNVNGFPLQGGLEAAKAAGRDLAQAVARALDRMELPLEAAKIAIHSTEPRLPLAAPPPVEKCRALLESEKQPERRRHFADLLAIAESGKPQSMRMPIRLLRLGPLCIVGMAHEPFAEYHQHIERVSPLAHNVVLAYTNGLECYVGTKEDYALGENGGYETSPRGAAFMFERRLPLAAEAEGVIHKALKDALTSLHP